MGSNDHITVRYELCSEGDADAEHTYYRYILCGKCEKRIGDTLQENIRESMTTCPNCGIGLDYGDDIEHSSARKNPMFASKEDAEIALSLLITIEHSGDFIGWEIYELTDDEIEQSGIKGMKWGIRRTPEQLGHRNASRQERREARQEARGRKRQDTEIRRGMAKFNKMSPEEQDAFMSKVAALAQVERLNAERIRAIEAGKIAQAQTASARAEAITKSVASLNLGMATAKKLADLPGMKDLDEALKKAAGKGGK